MTNHLVAKDRPPQGPPHPGCGAFRSKGMTDKRGGSPRRGGWAANAATQQSHNASSKLAPMDFYTVLALAIAVVIAAFIIWIVVPPRPRI